MEHRHIASTAFLTIQAGANAAKPGDTIYVMGGTYNCGSQCGGDLVAMVDSGTAAAPITFSAYPGTRPIIDTTSSWSGFHVGASYITIQGFEIVGDSKSVTMSQVTAAGQAPSDATPQADQSGIVVEKNVTQYFANGSTITNTKTPTHITILNNLVHDEPGSGIKVDDADYVTVENNTVYGNAFWSAFGDSGISLLWLTNTDGVASYKNYVMNNIAYLNQENVNSYGYTTPHDGNGIIIDDNQQTQETNPVPYTGRTLVANNVVYLNGGSGIHAFSSQHVDIVANTAYQNNQTKSNNYGQIFAYQCQNDINFYNNIMWAYPGKPYMTNNQNGSGIYEDYNLLYYSSGTPPNSPLGGMNVGLHNVTNANPQFSNASAGNFTISSTSPARGKATSTLEPKSDIINTTRPQSHGYDIGAYESLQ